VRTAAGRTLGSGQEQVVMEESHVGRELDVRLRDDEVMSEIEMTSNLMIAASEVDGPLTQAQVDAILGL
jgi:hypothetical protein